MSESIGLGPNPGRSADVDEHLNKWHSAGWELVAVTTISREGPVWDVRHNFFWKAPAD